MNVDTTAAYLAEVNKVLNYDPLTGAFTWRVKHYSQTAGTPAGGVTPDGYHRLMVRGVSVLGHRMAWLITHGRWPAADIDHIDRNRGNNAIANLREATRAQNLLNSSLKSNNRSGFKGLSWHPPSARWYGEVKIEGRRHRMSDKKREVVELWIEKKRKELHGIFACSG